jgi:hypothetical protein
MSDEAMTPEENSAVNDARTAWVHTEPGRFTIEKAFRAAWLAARRYYRAGKSEIDDMSDSYAEIERQLLIAHPESAILPHHSQQIIRTLLDDLYKARAADRARNDRIAAVVLNPTEDEAKAIQDAAHGTTYARAAEFTRETIMRLADERAAEGGK